MISNGVVAAARRQIIARREGKRTSSPAWKSGKNGTESGVAAFPLLDSESMRTGCRAAPVIFPKFLPARPTVRSGERANQVTPFRALLLVVLLDRFIVSPLPIVTMKQRRTMTMPTASRYSA